MKMTMVTPVVDGNVLPYFYLPQWDGQTNSEIASDVIAILAYSKAKEIKVRVGGIDFESLHCFERQGREFVPSWVVEDN